MKTHLQSKTNLYVRWAGIKARCTNPKNKEFKRYGKRGIKLCRRWHKFENFLSDMGQPPTPKHSIDRINNNGNYEPGNCRWVTIDVQQENRRNNTMITFNGRTHCLSRWAKEVGISRSLIILRIKNGWTTEQALTTPLKNKSHLISHGGKTQNIHAWAKELNITDATLRYRIKKGLSLEEVIKGV